MAPTTLTKKGINVPGLGSSLFMDTNTGFVYRLDKQGNPVEQVAFRSQDGTWMVIRAVKIISDQLIDTLERHYQAGQ